MQRILLSLILLLILSSKPYAQSTYFPPVPSSGQWQTIAPEDLGWCLDEIDSLYDFLDDKNTKGFIVLKGGKIVLEKYFDNFTADSLWYWASAGKTITAFLVGRAIEQGHLNITDKTSDHLGVGWTNCTALQESKITVRHQLTMTTGLDDGVDNVDCILDTCLVFKSDAGDRWAYHNAPYTLLENVVENASSVNYNTYTTQELKNKIGMNGLWIKLDYNNVYFSNTRSMARFGHMILNKCIWNGDTILNDMDYVNDMVNTSQSINESYGYLWWLNGKSSYMLPGLQFVFNGSYAKDAPDDMFAGIGKNGQIVGIVPSQDLVVVRMGNPPSALSLVPVTFYNDVWKYMNRIMCNTASLNNRSKQELIIYPNPVQVGRSLNINIPSGTSSLIIRNQLGLLVFEGQSSVDAIQEINTDFLTPGAYTLEVRNGETVYRRKVILIQP